MFHYTPASDPAPPAGGEIRYRAGGELWLYPSGQLVLASSAAPCVWDFNHRAPAASCHLAHGECYAWLGGWFRTWPDGQVPSG